MSQAAGKGAPSVDAGAVVEVAPVPAKFGEEQFRLLVDGVSDYAIFGLDLAGLVTSWNLGARRLKGYRPEEIIGRHFSAFYPPEDVAAGKPAAELAAATADGRLEDNGWRVRHDGSRFWANVVITALYDDEHHVTGFAKVTRDITERHNVEQALVEVAKNLEHAHDRFEALVAQSANAIVILNADHTLRYASPALERMLGGSPEDHLDKPLSALVHLDDRPRVIKMLAESARSEAGTVLVCECRLGHESGTWRHAEVVHTNLIDDPAVEGFVGNIRDITDEVEIAERLRHLALHDGLTQLPNRALFLDRLDQALAHAKRHSTLCALFYLDLDRFKTINDSLGHPGGDRLLILVAQRLLDCTRAEDTVARLGGDEFVVLTRSAGDEPSAMATAERIRVTLAEPIYLDDGQPVTVGVSIGIAFATDNHSGDTLLQEADTAMYRAKDRGRNRWEVFNQALRADARHRFNTERLLRRAIDDGTLVTLFQTVVALPGGKFAGAEALVRLKGDGPELITPDRFIDIADDSGLIVPLGMKVLDDACAEAARWTADADGSPSTMSVNLSARQLADTSLAGHVADALSRHELGADRLCLELTENTMIDAGDSMRNSIGDLHDIGVTMAIDDFGTGWSSLAYLRRFPVDILKLDRSFVSGINDDDGKDLEVVKAVIGLGHALDLTIVAEGVETDQQAHALIELHCDSAQGYLYGRPGPGSQLCA